MNERKSVTKALAVRYQKASKNEKKVILDEFCHLTSYNRCYATIVFKQALADKPAKVRSESEDRRQARGAVRIYDQQVLTVLRKVWMLMDCICGKRLAPILPEIVKVLESHGELKLKPKVRQKLQQISAATIDRLLVEDKKQFLNGSRARTKPGTLLKSQIPIRTFTEWNEARPGFTEIDLVGHDGGNASGDFCYTLDLTDVASGWTETRAIRNKAQVWVVEELKLIEKRLPFELLGIDSDNGSEFINAHLLRYCQERKLTFTRARSYRKNDNCFVEQKNYSVVRRAVGYARYDTETELKLLNQLYDHLRLYSNYFQPVMKLASKERNGSQVKKKYDMARTPYQRLLESEHLNKEQKQKLKKEYQKLNPAELKREITKLQNELLSLAAKKQPAAIGAKAKRSTKLERLNLQN